jgi:hypothetical protein
VSWPRQLIDTSTGAHIWADRFDGALDDMFDLQDQATATVVASVSPKLEQAEIERIKHKPTESLDAYDCFLRGVAVIHELARANRRGAKAVRSRNPDRRCLWDGDMVLSSAQGKQVDE